MDPDQCVIRKAAATFRLLDSSEKEGSWVSMRVPMVAVFGKKRKKKDRGGGKLIKRGVICKKSALAKWLVFRW